MTIIANVSARETVEEIVWEVETGVYKGYMGHWERDVSRSSDSSGTRDILVSGSDMGSRVRGDIQGDAQG